MKLSKFYLYLCIILIIWPSFIFGQSALTIGGQVGYVLEEPTLSEFPYSTLLFGCLIEIKASDLISLKGEVQYKYNTYQIELPLLLKLTSSPSSFETYFIGGLSLIFKHETSVEGIKLVLDSGFICGGGLELNKGSTLSPFFETRYTMGLSGKFELSLIWNLQLLAGIKFLI